MKTSLYRSAVRGVFRDLLLLGLPLPNGYLTLRRLFLNAPVLVSWLLVICALLLFTAISRLLLMVRVLGKTSVNRPVVTPSPVHMITR